jgi:hypothetical protein
MGPYPLQRIPAYSESEHAEKWEKSPERPLRASNAYDFRRIDQSPQEQNQVRVRLRIR